MTQALEGPETTRTRRMMETTEIKGLRIVAGKRLNDRLNMQIKPLTEWVDKRKREQDGHISMMKEERIARMVRENIQRVHRNQERLKRRYKEDLNQE